MIFLIKNLFEWSINLIINIGKNTDQQPSYIEKKDSKDELINAITGYTYQIKSLISGEYAGDVKKSYEDAKKKLKESFTKYTSKFGDSTQKKLSLLYDELIKCSIEETSSELPSELKNTLEKIMKILNDII